MGKGSELLFQLIAERLVPGADIESLDKKIWAMFGETWAVFFSDMSGFTSRTERFGIIHFLSLIYEMQRLLKPVIFAHNGLILKTEADNIFAVFRKPEQAVHCALEIHRITAHYNESRNEDYQLAVCLGIGYGKVLRLGDEDCYGSEVNGSSKLGEDIARAHETLVTLSTYEAIRHLEGLRFTEILSPGTEILAKYYRIEAEPEKAPGS